MPRHPRLLIPGATYHIYCRVARGEFVFDDDFEAIEFVETLREVRDLDGRLVERLKATGEPMTDRGAGIHILQRQADGSWKLAVDIWNSDNPPPEQ